MFVFCFHKSLVSLSYPKRSLLSKFMGASLEQFSRMCWAANWASSAKHHHGKGIGGVDPADAPRLDVRINVVVGDAVDTCDAICALQSRAADAAMTAADATAESGGASQHAGGAENFEVRSGLSFSVFRWIA